MYLIFLCILFRYILYTFFTLFNFFYLFIFFYIDITQAGLSEHQSIHTRYCLKYIPIGINAFSIWSINKITIIQTNFKSKIIKYYIISIKNIDIHQFILQ